jgi:hemerythrin-like domain-containing protein
MRSPTDVLRDEHRVILSALDLLETAASRTAVPAGWWEDVIGWLRSFADRNHHAKEEEALFPALIKAGVPSGGGPVDVMLEEHAQGRALIAAMADEAGRRPETARAYVRLLRDHIDKENGVLFPLAEAVLDEQAVAGVARAFEQVEVEQGAAAAVDTADAALARLARALGVG